MKNLKMIRSIVITALLCIACSCATQSHRPSQSETLNTWLTHSKQELIMKWGPPVRVASDGGTGEILVYAQQKYIPSFNGSPSYSFWDYTYMYADSTGKIYYWMTKRENVPPTQIDLNVYRKY